MNINDKGVIVKVSIGQSVCSYTDKGIEQEVKDNHGLANKAAKVVMFPLPEEYIAPIVSKGQKIRQIVYGNSRPWLDGGLRIVRKDRFEAFRDKVLSEVTEFNALADSLVSNYDAVKEATRTRMNGAWDESNFPSKDGLREKYYVDIDTFAVSDDFRSEENDNRKVQTAMNELRSMCRECIDTLLEKLNDETARFKCLLRMVARTVESVRNLNLTDDERLFEFVDKLESVFKDKTVESLKASKYERILVSDEVRRLRSIL